MSEAAVRRSDLRYRLSLNVRAILGRAYPRVIGANRTPRADEPAKLRIPKADAERLVHDYLLAHAGTDPLAVTLRQVASGTGVSNGAVCKTIAWITFETRRKSMRESSAALRDSHRQVFREWLKLGLPEKSADLFEYLLGLDEIHADVATQWLHSGYLDGLPPEAATRAQRAHFRQEVELLLELIRNEAAVAVSPDSSLRA